MTFKDWMTAPAIRTVVCKHADAEKYAVKNETDEFIFILDNSGKVGGYYKTYFE